MRFSDYHTAIDRGLISFELQRTNDWGQIIGGIASNKFQRLLLANRLSSLFRSTDRLWMDLFVFGCYVPCTFDHLWLWQRSKQPGM